MSKENFKIQNMRIWAYVCLSVMLITKRVLQVYSRITKIVFIILVLSLHY